MASGKTPTKCSKESILIPETGKSNLVLFNCGHIEHQECWEEIRKQNLTHCPYTKQHHFPIIIGLTRIEIKENRQKVLQALDTWKRNKIAQFRKYNLHIPPSKYIVNIPFFSINHIINYL